MQSVFLLLVLCYEFFLNATLAQLVEQLPCKHQVVGSNPSGGSILIMYKPLPEILTIKDSGIHGLGLFTLEDIEKNINLGITHVKDLRFENSYIRTPLGGFFNHSESPNCFVYEEGDFLYLITLKNIQAGEELTAEYTLYNPEKNE